MKIVCVNNSDIGLTVGKSYDVVVFKFGQVELPINLANSRLTAWRFYNHLSNDDHSRYKVTVKSDELILRTYDVSLFSTLEEWRDMKLEELGL